MQPYNNYMNNYETDDSASESEDNAYPPGPPPFPPPLLQAQAQEAQAADEAVRTKAAKAEAKQAELRGLYKVTGIADKALPEDFDQPSEEVWQHFCSGTPVQLRHRNMRVFLTNSLVRHINVINASSGTAAGAAAVSDSGADAEQPSMRFSSHWHMANVMQEVMRHVYADEGFEPFFVDKKMTRWVATQCRKCRGALLPLQ